MIEAVGDEYWQTYFDAIDRLLAPGGLLLIGHSETLTGLETGLALVEPSVYSR